MNISSITNLECLQSAPNFILFPFLAEISARDEVRLVVRIGIEKSGLIIVRAVECSFNGVEAVVSLS